ncbi:PAQR family membrane homeostasis protein TrhA [Stieleria maiorica]|uniref:PAQR family membrane homeostasis protein TrhA n=1 Tax=Stieleria maiorica TaxID=2795974 RepID=UPI0011C835EF|nr:hemolysin III family protein [Stieleria maiorica]
MNAPSPPHGNAPVRPDEEWANALTHGVAALSALLLGGWLVLDALPDNPGLAFACGAYIASVFATFSFSALSHTILKQPLLDTLRAWDQAMIYAMISGTYTPIIYRHAPDAVRVPLLTAIWVAAFAGIAGKLLLRHRVNNVATVSYLLLGWLPAIPLYGNVPSGLGWGMLLGGVLYTLGVIVLLNDSKLKYLHVVWHLFVISAALCHFMAIWWYVVA